MKKATKTTKKKNTVKEKRWFVAAGKAVEGYVVARDPRDAKNVVMEYRNSRNAMTLRYIVVPYSDTFASAALLDIAKREGVEMWRTSTYDDMVLERVTYWPAGNSATGNARYRNAAGNVERAYQDGFFATEREALAAIAPRFERALGNARSNIAYSSKTIASAKEQIARVAALAKRCRALSIPLPESLTRAKSK